MTADATDTGAKYPIEGVDWTEEHWHEMLRDLVSEGIVSWREATATVLGSINPSQVGTSIASKKTFQRHFERRKCWMAVRSWHFMQNGRCVDCGTRADLQADHAIPREFVGSIGREILDLRDPHFTERDPQAVLGSIEAGLSALLAEHGYGGIEAALVALLSTDLYGALKSGVDDRKELEDVADRLDNMVLRCRRHNVIRRPSHAKGGVTFLTAEAGLMWLLFVHRPKTYTAFSQLCRAYGLSMANIRFEEAWAMARWLQQVGLYEIDPASPYAPEPASPSGSE